MTSIKTLATAGLLLGAAAVSLATPASVSMKPAATKTTTATLTIVGSLGTDGSLQLTGANPVMTYDASKVTFVAGSFTKAAGTDWALNAENITAGGYNLVLTSNAGQPAGVIGTVTVTLAGANPAKLTMTTDSAVSDENYITYTNLTAKDAGVFKGAYRNLGGAIAGAPSTGPGKVVAVAAGTTLQLLNAADLTNVAAFVAPTVGPVSGRPAFGIVGTQSVIAVGDDAGKLTVVDAATGAAVGTQVTLAGKVSTPAIAADGIYAGVTPATGKATLVKVVAGVTSPVATLVGTSVLGSPAVYQGLIVVGTDAGVETFRTDGTQQAVVADAAGATIAPIIGAGGKGLSANATKLLGFNALTGAAAGATGATDGAVSEAWYEASTDTVVLGTASGKMLNVNLTTGVPTLAATPLTTGAVTAEPIVLNGVTYVIDATGNVASSAGLSVPLGAAGTKALAATGLTAGTDSIIAATADGGVAAVDF